MDNFVFYDDAKLHSFNNETENLIKYINSELVMQFSNNKRIAQPLYGIIIMFYRYFLFKIFNNKKYQSQFFLLKFTYFSRVDGQHICFTHTD